MGVLGFVLLITGLVCIIVIIVAKCEQYSRRNKKHIPVESSIMKTTGIDENINDFPSTDIEGLAEPDIEIDPLFEEVSRFIVLNQQGSASFIQRQFCIGFNRTGRLFNQLEAAGIIGPCKEWGKPRDVLINNLQSLESVLSELQPIIDLAREKEAERAAIHERAHEQIERDKIAERIKEKYRRRQLENNIRQELIDSGELFGEQPKRPKIPREVVDAVYTRDGGRCVYRGSTQNLQLDHIIPFSRGGATTLENLQLLCQKCNIEKSNKIG